MNKTVDAALWTRHIYVQSTWVHICTHTQMTFRAVSYQPDQRAFDAFLKETFILSQRVFQHLSRTVATDDTVEVKLAFAH